MTIERPKSERGTLVMHALTLVMLTRTLEVAGVEFIDENSGDPGLRLRKPQGLTKPK